MAEPASMERRRATQRDALTGAAERIIAEKGLASLRARDLAGEVGCAVGAIYNLFPDLDALVLEVNRRTLERLQAALAGNDEPSAGGGPDGAIAEIVRLGTAYLDFAQSHPNRWRALFGHAMAGGRALPDWYAEATGRVFRLVEEPLGALRPDLSEPARARLARTLFSAAHGMVDLGLDEKLAALPTAELRAELAFVLEATARGLGGSRS